MRFIARRRTLLLAAALSALAAGAFAQEDTALVPFIVNVDATVRAAPKEGTTSAVKSVEISAAANQRADLIILLSKTTGVTDEARNRPGVPAVFSNRAGKITVNLSAQSYRNAEISLYTVNGKRLLRCGAVDLDAAGNISRGGLAAGAYLLSVKGASGSAAYRLTHGGGGLDINVAFNAENIPSGRPLTKKTAYGEWTITVSAPEYDDSAYTLAPTFGKNPTQNITLLEDFVEIGGSKWKRKNLNIATEESWCYNNSADNCGKYGRLYTWTAAKTACPAGWHLPSREEWGGLATEAGGFSTAGNKLKSAKGWGNDGNGTDNYGFSALPGGNRTPGGGFTGVGSYGYWWTAEENDGSDNAYHRRIQYNKDDVIETSLDKSYGFSVRCLKD